MLATGGEVRQVRLVDFSDHAESGEVVFSQKNTSETYHISSFDQFEFVNKLF